MSPIRAAALSTYCRMMLKNAVHFPGVSFTLLLASPPSVVMDLVKALLERLASSARRSRTRYVSSGIHARAVGYEGQHDQQIAGSINISAAHLVATALHSPSAAVNVDDVDRDC